MVLLAVLGLFFGQHAVESEKTGMKKKEALALTAIFVLALGLRIYNLDYGLPDIRHPDELNLVKPALRIANSYNFDPDFFNYPALSIYVLAGVFWLLGKPELKETFIIGRWVVTLFGAATVVVVYAVARSLINKRAGIFAALLLAVTPYHVLDSHYVNTDIPAVFWGLLAFLFLLCWFEEEKLHFYLLAAVSIGLGGATKYNVLALAVLLPVSAVIRFKTIGLSSSILYMLFVGATACAAAYLLGAPYSIIRFNDVCSALAFERFHISWGHWGWDLNAGGVLYHRFLYQFIAEFPFVLGFPLYALSLAGALRRFLFQPKVKWLLFAVAFVLLFFPVGIAVVVFPRYLTPLIPFMVILAADFADFLLSRARNKSSRILVGIVLASILFYTIAMTSTMLRKLSPQTATLASIWIKNNVPPGDEIAVACFGSHLSIPWQRYKVVRFDLDKAVSGVYNPKWLVVDGWFELAYQRGKMSLTPNALFLQSLGSRQSKYEQLVRFRKRFLNEDVYGVLDPYFKNEFQNAYIAVYLRRE